MNSRAAKMLSRCNKGGRGLEIGPSFNPIAPKREGYNIRIMDHLDKRGLVEKYRNHPNVPKGYENIIEDVDYVWDGRPYPELVDGTFDYIVSAHLIEHVPDLIGHINDCCEILNPDGVYSLAVPDKRFSFDYYRPLTTAEDAVRRKGLTGYEDSLIVEYYEKVIYNGNDPSWDKLDRRKDFRNVYPPEEVKKVKANPQAYAADLHVSVFTPRSFFDLMNSLYDSGEIRMSLVCVDEDTVSGEFFAVFRKGEAGERTFVPMKPWRIPVYRVRRLAGKLLKR